MADRRDRDRGTLRAPARKVAVYTIKGHTRSRVTCEAMAAGIAAAGDQCTIIDEGRWAGSTDAEVAVFYGLEGNTPAIFEHYRHTPGLHAVYIDLGYWGRREGGRWTGYHKVVVNARHPTDYFMRRQRTPDRFRRFNVPIAEWRSCVQQNRGHILLAGMGDKGAAAEGFEPEQWERQAIAKIREFSSRTIVYRPKPSWKEARPIEGTLYSPRTALLESELLNCWAVVTHHSNVAVDALLAGIPVICEAGVAHRMSTHAYVQIETGMYTPPDRQQWAANLAYCQWSIEEMTAGLPWEHLKREGLV